MFFKALKSHYFTWHALKLDSTQWGAIKQGGEQKVNKPSTK